MSKRGRYNIGKTNSDSEVRKKSDQIEQIDDQVKIDEIRSNSISLKRFRGRLDTRVQEIVDDKKDFSDRILMSQEYDSFMKEVMRSRLTYANGTDLLIILNRVETEMREEMIMKKGRSKIDYSSITTTNDLSGLLNDQNRMKKDNTFSQTITRMIHLVMVSTRKSLGLHLQAFLNRVMCGMRGLHGYDEYYCMFLTDILITDFQYDHKEIRRTYISLTVPDPEECESLREYGLRVYREGTHSILMVLENSAELVLSRDSIYGDYVYNSKTDAFGDEEDRVPRFALFFADSNQVTSHQAVFILNTIHVLMKNILQVYLEKMFEVFDLTETLLHHGKIRNKKRSY